MIVEVCRSSHAYDLGPKLELYERAGVLEYVAVLLEERRVEWRVLRNGVYQLMEPDALGVLRSITFPGLWLDANALWDADANRMLAVLEQGLNSDECRRFLDG